MLAEERLKAGELDAALSDLQAEIRRQPVNAKYRIFLFQLLSVLGQWDRALNQLKVIGEIDASALPMVHTYREAIRCERLRERVFAGAATPLVVGEPTRWLAFMIEALRLTALGDYDRARPLREEAFELAPATAGVVDGAPFAWIADADIRLGPVLETVMNGAYYRVPFERLRAIRIAAPADLRDMVWAAAELDWPNGGTVAALVPTRYSGSEESDDAAIRLARRTDWREPEASVFIGLGQRILATDSGEYPLLEVREIGLETTAAPSEPARQSSEIVGGTSQSDG
jgi:type VI secretion system protein ImpE